MSIFDSIKNAFTHPVDINIISERNFLYSENLFPIKLELINKDSSQGIQISEIVTRVLKSEEIQGNRIDQINPNYLEIYKTSTPLQLLLPPNSEKTYYEYTINISLSENFGQAMDQVAPENQALQNLANFAGKFEQLGKIMNAGKKYNYRLSVEALDPSGTLVGFDNIQIYLLKPGELAPIRTDLFKS